MAVSHMNWNGIVEKIEENPIIAAIRDEKDLEGVLDSQVTTIFLLHANIFNIKSLVEKTRSHGKNVFIHIDFLEGIGKDNTAIDYIKEVICPDGIISTRSNQVRYAKEIGMFTIQRFFLIDSQSYDTTIKAVQLVQPDMIEVMPALMPKVIQKICRQLNKPVIAGGLIETKEDMIEILNAGAIGVSTGKKDLWTL